MPAKNYDREDYLKGGFNKTLESQMTMQKVRDLLSGGTSVKGLREYVSESYRRAGVSGAETFKTDNTLFLQMKDANLDELTKQARRAEQELEAGMASFAEDRRAFAAERAALKARNEALAIQVANLKAQNGELERMNTVFIDQTRAINALNKSFDRELALDIIGLEEATPLALSPRAFF